MARKQAPSILQDERELPEDESGQAPDATEGQPTAGAPTEATPDPKWTRVNLTGKGAFELRTPDELTPGQVIILRLLMPQRNLPLVIEDENDERVTKLVQVVDKCLAIVSPELANQGISFVKKLDVLDHYARYSGLIREPGSKGKGKGKSDSATG
jgi:hypothetical protein